jgi:hypothetical protein
MFEDGCFHEYYKEAGRIEESGGTPGVGCIRDACMVTILL